MAFVTQTRRDDTRGSERLNAICPYFTMFPLAVPTKQLRRVRSAGWVLDPFCGRGSTNYAARLLGLGSVGIDSNPVAAAIAEGKMVAASADAIAQECTQILETTEAVHPPDGDFWSACYESRTLLQICQLRSALLNDCSTPTRKALRALMLGLLHGPRNKGAPSYLSNQMPRTYAAKPDYATRFWARNGFLPRAIDVADLVRRKARHYFDFAPSHVPFRIICGDSRTTALHDLGLQFSAVVTSPPYFGMRTYVPDQWLRYWFLGGPSFTTYRHPDQLSHGSPDDFAGQLAEVWTNVARTCALGASIMIRFGGIHDRKARPKDILTASLAQARAKLRILTVRSAGSSSGGKRQADQFQRALRAPIEELDFYVRFEGMQ